MVSHRGLSVMYPDETIHLEGMSAVLSPTGTCRGYDGPHDCGNYNSAAWETGFFVSDGGSWNSEYGHFFLAWYSRQLMQHADRVLGAAAAALNRRGRPRKAMAVKEVCPQNPAACMF